MLGLQYIAGKIAFDNAAESVICNINLKLALITLSYPLEPIRCSEQVISTEFNCHTAATASKI